MFKRLRRIYHIIPTRYRKKSIRYLLLSIGNVLMDLLSIAYLIPLFIFILDKEQMPDFLKQLSFFDEAYLLHWTGGIVLLFILKNYLQIGIIRFQSTLVFQIATSLAASLARKLLGSSLEEFQNLDKGKALQKTQMAGTDFSNHILLSLNTFFTELGIVGAIAVVSFSLYPLFSLLIFLIAGSCFLLLYLLRKKKIQRISSTIRSSYSVATSHLLNIIDGFLEIKSLGQEDFFQNKYEGALDAFNANFAQLKQHQNSTSKYLEVFIIIGLCLFLYYLNQAFDIAADRVILISFIAGISLKLFPSISKLIIAFTNYRSYQYTLDVLDQSENKTPTHRNTLPFESGLRLENISFSYQEQTPLLDGVDLEIKPSQILGIKGRSGIGKTTLLNILMGFLPPDSGSIYLNNNLVTPGQGIFSFMGYVPQQPFLLQGSLRENICMGKTHGAGDEEQILKLIDALSLTEWLKQLPSGLDTPLSHNSLGLSGGQKQRIALLRTLYAQPKLLILDEVTNQLDEALESKILTFLKSYTQQHQVAIVLVSHGSAMPSICDQVYELRKGQLTPVTHG